MLSYSAKTPYRKDDIVLHEGTFYICTSLCCGSTPFNGSPYWKVYELTKAEMAMLNPAPLCITKANFGTYAERVVNSELVERIRDAFANGCDIYLTSDESTQYANVTRYSRLISYVDSKDYGGHNDYVMVSTEDSSYYVFMEE